MGTRTTYAMVLQVNLKHVLPLHIKLEYFEGMGLQITLLLKRFGLPGFQNQEVLICFMVEPLGRAQLMI